MEDTRRDPGRLGGHRASVSLPAIKATIQDVGLEHTHDTEHPPRARRREKTWPIVNDNGVVGRNAHRSHILGKITWRGERVRQWRVAVGNSILVEEHGSWNMTGFVFAASIPLLCRQIPGSVDDRQAGLPEPLFKPVRVDGKGAVLCHALSPRCQ